jgi:sulfonate transport system substrate-binding protein
VLTTGRHLSSNNSFYLASRGFAEKHADLITLLFDELTKNDAFSRENRKDTVALFASFAGLDVPTVTRVFERRPPSPVVPVSPSMVDDQQKVADAVHRLGLIPRPVKVAEIVWRPDAAAVGTRR